MKGECSFAFTISTDLTDSTFVFKCHITDFFSSFDDSEFHVLSSVGVSACFFTGHGGMFWLVYHGCGQEFRSLHDQYPLSLFSKRAGNGFESCRNSLADCCGRIRTCDQSITRVLKFPKRVDYIITILTKY